MQDMGKNNTEARLQRLERVCEEDRKRWRLIADYIKKNEERWQKNEQKSDERFQKIEERIEKIEERIEKIEERIEALLKVIYRKLEE